MIHKKTLESVSREMNCGNIAGKKTQANKSLGQRYEEIEPQLPSLPCSWRVIRELNRIQTTIHPYIRNHRIFPQIFPKIFPKFLGRVFRKGLQEMTTGEGTRKRPQEKRYIEIYIYIQEKSFIHLGMIDLFSSFHRKSVDNVQENVQENDSLGKIRRKSLYKARFITKSVSFDA